jgi:hypothetical protein
MATYYNPRIVTNGLVLCLDAANAKSYPSTGTTWTDLSGLGNGGTLTNGPTFNSTSSGSIVFDGTNDFSTIGNSGFSSGTSPATISIWVRMTSRASLEQYVVSYGSGTNVLGFGTGFFSGFDVLVFKGSDLIYLAGASPALLNTWANLVGVFTGSAITMYRDGISQGTSAVTWTVTSSTARVGCSIANNNFFQGNVSHVSVYNRVLSAGEVQQNFNALRSRYGI